jgi:hypothetical protein
MNYTSLEFRVQPYGSSKDYYSIEYRKKYSGFWSFILNALSGYQYLYRTYHVGLLSRYPRNDHPVLISSFDEATKLAQRYKDNPKELEAFLEREAKEYERIYKECDEYHRKRNQSTII